ncbi:MAG: heme exporter protein CcmB [Flavobacteriales bacterium]|jgi:heme exporter protein B
MFSLLKKEIQLEWRQKHALAGVLLYVLATVFVCYLALQSIEAPDVWNALLWITALFTAFNALQRTFHQETGGTLYYLYTLASPRQIMLAKMIYYGLQAALLNGMSFALFLFFFGTGVFSDADMGQFLTGLLLGSTGLGMALTFLAGLVFRSGAGAGLVAVLGFPVVMPLMITMVRFSRFAMDGLSWSENGLNLLILLVLNAAFLILSLVLFPYLWRD